MKWMPAANRLNMYRGFMNVYTENPQPMAITNKPMMPNETIVRTKSVDKLVKFMYVEVQKISRRYTLYLVIWIKMKAQKKSTFYTALSVNALGLHDSTKV